MDNQTKDWINNLEQSLNKDEMNFIKSLAGIRSNKISVEFIREITLIIDNKKVKISHIASVQTLSTKDLIVTAFDRKHIQAIIKSILAADLGYRTEKTVGEIAYLSLAPFTTDTRIKLIQKCKDNLENAKIAFRNSRQRALAEIKISKLSIDNDRRAKKKLDEIVNLWTSKATRIYEQKITELKT